MDTKNKGHEYSDSGKVKSMCGIAGELNSSARANREAVNALVSSIAYRGPEDRSLWSSPFGWNQNFMSYFYVYCPGRQRHYSG
jgi:hypothetical protein